MVWKFVVIVIMGSILYTDSVNREKMSKNWALLKKENKISLDMENGMRTIFPCRLVKSSRSKLFEGYLDGQTPVESWKP